MKFFAIASAAFAAFSGLVAAQSPTVVVKDIQTLTQMSSDANTMISSLDIVTVVTQGYQVPQTIKKIGVLVGNYTLDFQGAPGRGPIPFGDADAQTVVAVLSTFVSVHQQLLATLIGKKGLLELFFLGPPIAATLRALEAYVDKFAYYLIDLIPTQQTTATQQHASLMASLENAIKQYSS